MSTSESDDIISVMIVDDHTLFREGVASLLERTGDVILAGEAASGEEAIVLADTLLPDIVLMDLKMPGMGGIEATRTITNRSPHIGVIVLTMFEDDESIFSALKAGARGYVLKDADRGALLRAIRAVSRGEALLSPSIARRVLEQFNQPPPPAPESVLTDELTPREMEVLTLITRGLRNKEIAQQLFISEKTVGTHISNIFSKLQVVDRSQAILQAFRSGLVSPEY